MFRAGEAVLARICFRPRRLLIDVHCAGRREAVEIRVACGRVGADVLAINLFAGVHVPGTGQAASHDSGRIKLPDPRDLVRPIQLAVLHAGSKEDEAACLRIAYFQDDLGMGPVSTPSGERQTIQQFFPACISSKRVGRRCRQKPSRPAS